MNLDPSSQLPNRETEYDRFLRFALRARVRGAFPSEQLRQRIMTAARCWQWSSPFAAPMSERRLLFGGSQPFPFHFGYNGLHGHVIYVSGVMAL